MIKRLKQPVEQYIYSGHPVLVHTDQMYSKHQNLDWGAQFTLYIALPRATTF